MQGDLARRVPSDGSGDDFDQLAGNLNRMLDRIEGLMAGIRQISDNIAHDLRTPLSRLRTRLELIRGEPPADTDPAEIDAAIADAEELLGTFNALLRIARIESGGRRAGFAPTDLGPLLADLVELYEPLAADKGQALVLTPAAPLEPGEPTAESDPLRVNGDRDLLFQAIANLVDNAIKYSPEQGRIEIDARRDGDRISIQVADTGSGIPPEQRAKVFQRFYRLEDSRTTPGNGLGLSLVQAVAQLHGAEISLDDNRPGLRVTLILKALTD
jgi:signal transduction histidine kinase